MKNIKYKIVTKDILNIMQIKTLFFSCYICSSILTFHVISNYIIHTLLFAVCELKNPSMSSFQSGLIACGWLKHIQAVMEASVFIARVRDNCDR